MNSNFGKTALAIAVAATFGAAHAAEVDTKGGIKIKSDDGQFVSEINGRMHFDTYFFDNKDSEADEATDIRNDNGTDFRRLRLSAKGTMYGVYEGKIELDFRSNRANGESTSTVMRDVWLAYSGFELGKLTLGHQKVPMGLDELTSSNYIWFIERAAPVSLITDGAHRRGLQFSGQRENFTYALMGYDTNNRVSGTAAPGATNDSAGFGLGGRLTWSPIKDKTQVLHLGLSAAKELDVEGLGDRTTRYEMNLADPVTLIDFTSGAGSVSANPGDGDELAKYGVELAYLNGPFSAQAEYLKASLESSQDAIGATPAQDYSADLGGYYVAASYFLTGETRPYRASSGTFDRIKPDGKSGAWEVLGRYSSTEGEIDTIDGQNEVKSTTLGVNYYINPQIRLMANYISSEVDAVAVATTGTAAQRAAPFKDDPKALALRVQFDF